MSKQRIYLDYNASAPLIDEARLALLSALDLTANASSVHGNGRAARAIIEKARVNVAKLVGTHADNVVFTSGATEAAQLAISPILSGKNGQIELQDLYVSAIEHPCVLAGGRFDQSRQTIFPVNSRGLVDVDALQQILAQRQKDAPFLVCLMLANNETGVIQPVAEVASIARQFGGYLLVDAVQAAGRLPIDMAELNADFLILSSHKIGGPQGAGALVLADKSFKPQPLLKGGGQEFHLRAGTENTAAIAGFGAACVVAVERLDHMRKMIYIRDAFEEKLIDICRQKNNSHRSFEIFGADAERLANTTCFSLCGINAETALISLDLDGISVSSGSACSSGKVERSHVLKAMGRDDEIAGAAIRVSTGWDTRPEELELFLEAWSSYLKRLV